MPIDPERALEVGGWLTKARMDLEAGAHLLSADLPFTASAVFHAQQAAEKSLKAFLTWHDLPFRKTHDLSEIGQQCVGLDASLEETCRLRQSR